MLVDGEQYLTVNDVEHWIKISGIKHKTVPLVVVHGGPGGNNYNFEHTIGPDLEAFTTVIYYEQRGCGRSSRPASSDDYSIDILTADLEALLEQLELEKVVLLGFSFGGELALEFSLRHPERVIALILQAPSVGSPEERAQVQLKGFKEVARGEASQVIDGILKQPLPPTEQLEKVWTTVDSDTVDLFLFQNQVAAKRNRQLWRESGLVNTGDMHGALLRQRRSPLIDRAASVVVPVLVIVGRHDRNVGVDLSTRLAGVLPQAQLAIFEHSAHFPEMEEPGLYAKTVRGFCRNRAELSLARRNFDSRSSKSG